VFAAQILISKAATVDALAAGAIPLGEIATLNHEIFYDPMKRTMFKIEPLGGVGAEAFLARAQRSKVLARPRTLLIEQLEYDAAHGMAIEINVKKATHSLAFD